MQRKTTQFTEPVRQPINNQEKLSFFQPSPDTDNSLTTRTTPASEEAVAIMPNLKRKRS